MPSGTVIDLTGMWQLREAIGQTWHWYVSPPANEALNNAGEALEGSEAASDWSAARVPGSVVDALAHTGALPDPRRGWGTRHAEWTGRRSWVFRRDVVLDDSWVGTRVTLEIDGIDPGGTVFWDGERVGRLDGIYAVGRFPVRVETAAAHRVAIVVDRARDDVPQVGRTEDVRHHAPRVNQGWDFCPPFPHQGLWRPVRLRRGACVRSLAVSARCSGAGGAVSVEVSADGDDGTAVSASIGDAHARGVLRDGAARLLVTLGAVERWWPRALGSPRLYDVEVMVGEQRLTRRVGFRDVNWTATPGAPASAYPYGLEVNEREVSLPGVNWTPADAQFSSVTRARMAHLLCVAVEAGATIIRVWGGGLVETDEFYELCDEMGVLVWQEFSQSSSGLQSAPSEHPDFVRALERDARRLTSARAHHPSLVLWGGGNELEDAHGPLRTERSAALTALAEIVADSPGDAGWIPTSPSGPAFHHRRDVIAADPLGQHDVHGPWEHQGLREHRTLAAAGTALAHTEFGVEGMANRRLHEHLVPEESREPAGKENPLYRHLGEWWNNEAQVQAWCGGGLDLEELRRASQWLQATGLAISIEADRRRWPRTSMVLPWQLNESYPNAWGTALVGFDGELKPAWGAVARAFATERATMVTPSTAWEGGPGRAEVWLWSQPGRPPGGSLSVTAVDLGGTVLAHATVDLGAVREPELELSLEVPGRDGAVIWRAVWSDALGAVIDDERIVECGGDTLAPLRDLPQTTLEVSARAGAWTVRNTGATAAVAWGPRDRRPAADARLLALAHDPRPLMPGETTQLRVLSGEPRRDDFIVDAWNADAASPND